ncbi:hypothetical protein [Sphingomonas sp.]|uniref:hypothetical protein n=1 Tax=Sphingomonas sp. TaxID=28214 RepID=UPI003B00A1ED
MPAAAASWPVDGASFITRYSQNAIMFASPENRRMPDALPNLHSHNAMMDKSDEKNGGPNHLKAWMRFRGVSGQALADALGGTVTAGMVSDLTNSNRQLSAKWLRRIAPILKTTPGHLLDHDPSALPTGLAEIWFAATEDQRRQLIALAAVVVPGTGTDG